jgi:mycofactocin precursor
MSERLATTQVLDSTEVLDSTGVTDPAAEPELATADLLVEEVSIDGMCGVY